MEDQGAIPRPRAQQALVELAPPPPPMVDCTAVACVSLTFDDGPDHEYTPEVLRILEREAVRATFFVVGYGVVEYPEQIRMMVDAGHDVGNHSWDHSDLTTLSAEEIAGQVSRTNAAIVAAGATAPALFRAPYGAVTDGIRPHIAMPVIHWDVDPNDWEDDAQPGVVTHHVLSTSRAGSIVLLHSINATTVEALPDIIGGLRRRGYELVPVSMLRESAERSLSFAL